MNFTISREALLTPLNLVSGVVERRQTLPILANVQISLQGDSLSLTGTDLEVELVGRVKLEQAVDADGDITVPARKLADICKALPDNAELKFSLDDQKLTVRAGRSRFSLSTLPAADFPSVEQGSDVSTFTVGQGALKRLIERTGFAMAQQDVRYYLNGMLWEISSGRLRLVATDGHRLAMCTHESDSIAERETQQIIIPRKGVMELARLLNAEGEDAQVIVGSNHIRVVASEFTFTSKLIDGKFPDYDRVLPRGSNKMLTAPREELRQAFARASILSNEKYRGIRMNIKDDTLTVVANNPEQEEAEETLSVQYEGDALEIGFNVTYLTDVLSVVDAEKVRIALADPNSSALIEEEAEENDSVYVVMPMRL